MEEITKATVEKAITEPEPMMDALSHLLKSVAMESTAGLASVLVMLGVDPATMPSQYFIQAMLVASDGVFQPVTREDFIACYDTYEQVRKVLEDNPDLHSALIAKKAGRQEGVAAAADALLDGEF
jgi:hypothetical protein